MVRGLTTGLDLTRRLLTGPHPPGSKGVEIHGRMAGHDLFSWSVTAACGRLVCPSRARMRAASRWAVERRIRARDPSVGLPQQCVEKYTLCLVRRPKCLRNALWNALANPLCVHCHLGPKGLEIPSLTLFFASRPPSTSKRSERVRHHSRSDFSEARWFYAF